MPTCDSPGPVDFGHFVSCFQIHSAGPLATCVGASGASGTGARGPRDLNGTHSATGCHTERAVISQCTPQVSI